MLQRQKYGPIALSALMWLCLGWQGIGAAVSQDPKGASSSFPSFELYDLRHTGEKVSLDTLKGKPYVIHIWSTWCSTCLKEHGEWISLKTQWKFPLVGINYRDNVSEAQGFLKRKGDPYLYALHDDAGQLGVALGLRGVPATYLLDQNGKIRLAHVGGITKKQFEETFLPLFRQLTH